MHPTIGIIGFGNMGQAMYPALCGVFGPDHILVVDKNTEKRALIPAAYGFGSVHDILLQTDILILAIKPQSFQSFCEDAGSSLHDTLVISILAGISLQSLQNNLHTNLIVRAMPNVAAKVGKSLTAWIATPEAWRFRSQIERIFQSFGTSLPVQNEMLLNAFTALAGSGPAYFYLLVEQLKNAALNFGFSENESDLIARSVFSGSAAVLQQSNLSAEELRLSVTSKGGTTQAAVEHLQQNGFEKVFQEALKKAKERAEELNR